MTLDDLIPRLLDDPSVRLRRCLEEAEADGAPLTVYSLAGRRNMGRTTLREAMAKGVPFGVPSEANQIGLRVVAELVGASIADELRKREKPKHPPGLVLDTAVRLWVGLGAKKDSPTTWVKKARSLLELTHA